MSSYSSTDEQQLFVRIAAGDEEAYRQLFRIYVPLLGPVVYGIVKSQVLVDDIVQETLLRVWLHRDKLPDIEKPRSWILRIAFLMALAHLRSRKTSMKAADHLALTGSDFSAATEEQLAFRNTIALVAEAVRQLPPQQKKIYQLSREGGLSPSEIARHLQLSEQTVKNTLVNALKSMRAYLKQRGLELLCLLWWFGG